MKNNFLKAALVAVFLCLSACSTLQDIASNNPLSVSFVVRQAVAQYIAQGETIEEERSRALAVVHRVNLYLEYLDVEKKVTPSELLSKVRGSIDWSKLSAPDKALIIELVNLISHELQQATEIDQATKITLADLFNTAIKAAQLYAQR